MSCHQCHRVNEFIPSIRLDVLQNLFEFGSVEIRGIPHGVGLVFLHLMRGDVSLNLLDRLERWLLRSLREEAVPCKNGSSTNEVRDSEIADSDGS